MLPKLSLSSKKIPQNPFKTLSFSPVSSSSESNLTPKTHENDIPALLKLLRQDPLQSLSHYSSLFRLLARSQTSVAAAGRQLHARILLLGLPLSSSPPLSASVAAMYSSSGDLPSAALLLRQTPNPSTLLFNALIRGHSLFGAPISALQVFVEMLQRNLAPDHYTFPFALKCSADLNCLALGQSIHSLCFKCGFEMDRYVGSSIINMYAKNGEVRVARKLFDGMGVRDASCWNALIDGYMKAGDVSAAEELFRMMPERNVVSWTAMIAGYSQNGVADRALRLFDELVRNGSAGVKPNWVTVTSVLPACAHAAALQQGRRIHRYARDGGFDTHVAVRVALMTMYAKCGSLDEARRCFDGICKDDKDVVVWNAMIMAYTSHGRGIEAVSTYEDMIRLGVCPDLITFTSLLSGCSHAGFVDRGMKYFESMRAIHM